VIFQLSGVGKKPGMAGLEGCENAKDRIYYFNGRRFGMVCKYSAFPAKSRFPYMLVY
jgi:hypothetical protein